MSFAFCFYILARQVRICSSIDVHCTGNKTEVKKWVGDSPHISKEGEVEYPRVKAF